MAVRTLIVEDEPMARETLRDFAAGVGWLEITGEAADGLTAVRVIEDTRPDLVLLDVQMPELSGLQILERISHEPEIVFTTAHDEYAVTAFELGALEYLLKPFGRERFELAMERVRRRLEGPGAGGQVIPPSAVRAAAALCPARQAEPLERLFVRDARGTIVQLRLCDVTRLAAADDYVEVHAGGASYLVNISLGDFERRLDPARFRRVHRSHIVNLDHVRSIEQSGQRLTLRLSDGSRIAASRAGAQALRGLIL